MKNKEMIPNIEREGWNAEKLVEEASNEESDDIVRKILRGDETEGDADERDIAGVPNFKKTRQKKSV